jgi:hypothetical protein
MSMIASHPEVHLLPPSIALRVGTDLGYSVIHDPHGIADDPRIVPFGVGRLVDSGERDESESHALRAQTKRGFLSHPPVDGEPAPHIAAKVGSGRARDERETLTDSLAAPESPPNYAQRAKARLGELEDGRRRAVNVAIHEAHLGADIAPRVP